MRSKRNNFVGLASGTTLNDLTRAVRGPSIDSLRDFGAAANAFAGAKNFFMTDLAAEHAAAALRVHGAADGLRGLAELAHERAALQFGGIEAAALAASLATAYPRNLASDLAAGLTARSMSEELLRAVERAHFDGIAAHRLVEAQLASATLMKTEIALHASALGVLRQSAHLADTLRQSEHSSSLATLVASEAAGVHGLAWSSILRDEPPTMVAMYRDRDWVSPPIARRRISVTLRIPCALCGSPLIDPDVFSCEAGIDIVIERPLLPTCGECAERLVDNPDYLVDALTPAPQRYRLIDGEGQGGSDGCQRDLRLVADDTDVPDELDDADAD